MPFDVILTANYSPWSKYSGGAQKSVHMVAVELARQGLRVAVVGSRTPWEKVAVPEGLPYSMHWAWFFALKPGISSPLRFLNGISFFFKVRSLSSPVTVLHGNGDEASLLWLIRAKRKFVYTNRYPEFPAYMRGLKWSRPWTWLRVLFREPRFAAIALALRHADRVTVTSAYSRTEVAGIFGVDLDEGAVVYNGIDPVFLDSPERPGNDRKGILFYGRLTRSKGSDLLLEAYALLPEGLRAGHPLAFLGAGPLRESLETRAGELGVGVAFGGWKQGADLVREIQARKLVCLPSREESFGNTVAETLALGQALVTTTVGSIPEVAGPFGTRIPGMTPRDLAASLEAELARDRDAEEVRRQREFIRSRYSWSKAAERFRESYGN